MDPEMVVPLAESIFFNISLYFSIKRCLRNEHYVEKLDIEYGNQESRSGIFDLVVGREPVQNRTVWESFFGMFSPYEEVEIGNMPVLSDQETIDTTTPFFCDTVILATQQESIYAEILVQWIFVFLLLSMILFISICMLFVSWRKHGLNKPKKGKTIPPLYKEMKTSKHVEELCLSCSNKTEILNDVKPVDLEETIPKSVRPSPVQLTSGKFHIHADLFKGTRTDFFLEHTLDKFLVELDKKMGIGSTATHDVNNSNFLTSVLSSSLVTGPSASSGNNVAGALTAPRVARRSTSLHMRRNRQTVTSLPVSSSQQFDSTTLLTTPWHELQAMNHKMEWSNQNYSTVHPDFNDIIEPRLRNVLQSHQSSCPIKSEQLASAIFIVNYVILMLEKELSMLISEDGFRFISFKLTGSMKKGTKINKASHFDLLMLLNCAKCTFDLAYYHSITNDIPPGNILITARENKQSVHQKKFLKRAYVDECFHQVFSPGEAMVNACELVDRALTNIMTRNKKIIDRLPFTIGRSSDPELIILLNTRLLHGLGFGIPEISIRLLPAIPLHQDNSLLLTNLYAVVPAHLQDVQNKPSSLPSQGLRIFRQPENLEKDLLWNLSFCDLEAQYLRDMTNRIKDTGVQSCYHVCLQLLKALFANSNRTSLLNRGEIESYNLETILYFLLLESNPSNWTFNNLPCRLSDAIHFLRSAVQSQWLPNFFIANPHLVKKSPTIKHIPFLNCTRQVNLFANMSAETSRKTLLFINSRLTETGISAALKDEYSTDMWEYEFFIFG